MVDKDYKEATEDDVVETAATQHCRVTDRDLRLCFTENRHVDAIQGINCITQTWRMKERMKTVSVALVLCLNVGVDPPDVVKTQPCARLECWIDPLSISSPKALEAIGCSLQKQYERWQPRARYKQSLDPTAEEVKKLCSSLRRNAKEERVLFHYNGHGVPKATSNGEIWVFNRNYTQYIPLSVYDLQTWMGAPSIYVYDCSNAGIIVDSFKQFATQHESEYDQSRSSSPPPPSFHNCIQLAACGAEQSLPMNPDLPADLFTACLTTPIKVAIKWFVLQSTSKLVPKVTTDIIDRIPGQIADRRTMMGELNWIFTAITDTIAWNTLPRDLFQKLFRQDLLVASLFRNFLLAERILRSCDCTPVSSPALPPTYQHAMWQAWDLTLDLSLGQLPGILKNGDPFEHLPFFEEQLTAFQVWLDLGSERRNPPEQLPIVLQVLLSQVHRFRALELLGKFLDLGPWAVNLALSVGIFPYVLKLLQSCAKELRPLLVFIWAKILAVDNTCQADLVRDKGHKYFLSVLQDTSVSAEHRTQAAFVLACIVNDFRDGQEAAVQGSLVSICLEQLTDPCAKLRQWVALCLGRLWDHYEKARWTGVRDIAHEKLYTLLQDESPEVRAAAVYALGTFVNSVSERSEHANNIDHSVIMTLVNTVSSDMSPLVRKELVVALQWVVLAFEHAFLNVALQEHNPHEISAGNITPPNNIGLRRIGSRDRLRIMSPSTSHSSGIDSVDFGLKRVASSSSMSAIGAPHLSHGYTGSLGTLPGLSYGSVYMKIWAGLCVLDNDPHPEVAKMANIVTRYIRNQVKDLTQREDGRIISSISLPPSPNRTSYLGESPPIHLSSSTELQKIAARGAMASRNRKFKDPNTINEEDEKEQPRKALVETQFIAWSCGYFAVPVMKEKLSSDIESKFYYEREWRYMRNAVIRKDAVEEQMRAVNCRLESQVFNTRTQTVPSIVQFHPYDQQIAVATKDNFGIWDWGTGAKLSYAQCKSTKQSFSRITSLNWVNSFDVGMLMSGSDDGSVNLWRPNGNKEATLVSAWQAHSELYATNRIGANSSSGLLLTWEQYTQSVISSGDTRVLRFWDAHHELRNFDIPTGADCSVTCLDSSYASTGHERDAYTPKFNEDDDHGLIMSASRSRKKNTSKSEGAQKNESANCNGLVLCGCADGSVRVFDRRSSPNEARIKTWMEHAAPVLAVQLQGNNVISGSANGDVIIYDIRTNDTISTTQAMPTSQNVTAIAIHRKANTYACGSANHTISIHNMAGTCLNVIRFYEGFMGYRIGAVSCLAYHPHKVALATGTLDSSVSVYCLDNRR